jgi:hypothetical protein
MSFSPNLFLSNVRAKDGLAKPCRFEILLPIPPYINQFIENSVLEKILNLPNSIFNDVSDAVNTALSRDENSSGYSKTSNATMSRYLALQCESTELPGKTFATADVKIYGPIFKVPYMSMYTDITFNFLCTNQFYERKLFDRWLEAIQPTDTNNMRFPKGENSRYMTNIKIIQYDDFIKQIYAVELQDAFPIGISSQPLNWSEDNFHRVSVQFAYQKFKTIYDGNYDLGSAAAALFGSAGSRLLPFGNAL